MNRLIRGLFFASALLAAACDKNSTSPTTTTPPPAAATVTEHFVGTIGVGGSGFYAFTVPLSGTVILTLNSLAGVDGNVAVGVGVGTPAGFGCSTSNTSNVTPGADPVSNTYPPGILCARVSDVGNLTGATTFDLSIAHP